METFDMGKVNIWKVSMETFDMRKFRMETFELRKVKMETFDMGKVWMETFDMRKVKIETFDMRKVRMETLDMRKFMMETFDMKKFMMETFDMRKVTIKPFDMIKGKNENRWHDKRLEWKPWHESLGWKAFRNVLYLIFIAYIVSNPDKLRRSETVIYQGMSSCAIKKESYQWWLLIVDSQSQACAVLR